jgi:tetratricopeptide (TPR) repeat protein
MKTTLKSFLYFLTGSISFALLIPISACNDSKGMYFIVQADAEQKKGNYEKAKEYCTEAIKLDSNDMLAFETRAIQEMVLLDNQSALKDLDRVVKLRPKHAVAYYYRGDVRRLLKDTLGAIEDYKKAMEMDSSIVHVYERLGDIEIAKKDSGSAREFYNKAIKHDTNNGRAYFGIAWIELGKRTYKAAASDFERSIKIALSGKNTLYLGSAFQGLGVADEFLKDTLAALTSFSQSIQYGASHIKCWSYHYRANLELSMKDTDKALKDYTMAIKNDPKFAWPYYGVGYIESLRHEYKESINDFTTGISLMPDKRGYYRRGLDYIESGEKKSGCEDLYKAKEMGDRRADSVIKIHCK